MIAEAGTFFLWLVMILAAFQMLLKPLKIYSDCQVNILRTTNILQVSLLLLASMCLWAVLLSDDFSVAYVAANSNSSLPLVYKLSAFWGGHEGSLLLWIVILSCWSLGVALKSHSLPASLATNMQSVLSFILFGFVGFIIFTSNPFARLLPESPLDGRDLNPLLQDPGLIIHPPLLYMGYVGFCVPFAFAVAVLLEAKLEQAWLVWLRSWTLVAWGMLTVGITLGSWWAYYELGWGGWWFWDPVENASFMPWLLGAALIHALRVTQNCQGFRGWLLLLAILTFTLSLLGTFIVRSGIISSIHAFAVSADRGLYILVFMTALVGATLILYSVRVDKVIKTTKIALFSREAFMCINNLLLFVAFICILLGTIYPIMVDIFFQQKLSVGYPFFNAIFIPLMLPLLLLLPTGMQLKWGKNKLRLTQKELTMPSLALALAVLMQYYYLKSVNFAATIGIFTSFWILLSVCKTKLKGGGLASNTGMLCAHLGLGLLVLGISINANYSVEKDIALTFGETYKLQDHTFTFLALDTKEGSNYISSVAQVSVEHADKTQIVYPEKRHYVISDFMMTETALIPGLWNEFYLALGEPINDSWSFRVQYKPFVRVIWLGGLLLALGAFCSAYLKINVKRDMKNVQTYSPNTIF